MIFWISIFFKIISSASNYNFFLSQYFSFIFLSLKTATSRIFIILVVTFRILVLFLTFIGILLQDKWTLIFCSIGLHLLLTALILWYQADPVVSKCSWDGENLSEDVSWLFNGVGLRLGSWLQAVILSWSAEDWLFPYSLTQSCPASQECHSCVFIKLTQRVPPPTHTHSYLPLSLLRFSLFTGSPRLQE